MLERYCRWTAHRVLHIYWEYMHSWHTVLYHSGSFCTCAFKTVNHVTRGQSERLFWSGPAVLYSHTWMGNSHSCSVCGFSAVNSSYGGLLTQRLHMISLHRKNYYRNRYTRKPTSQLDFLVISSNTVEKAALQWRKCSKSFCCRCFVISIYCR